MKCIIKKNGCFKKIINGLKNLYSQVYFIFQNNHIILFAVDTQCQSVLHGLLDETFFELYENESELIVNLNLIHFHSITKHADTQDQIMFCYENTPPVFKYCVLKPHKETSWCMDNSVCKLIPSSSTTEQEHESDDNLKLLYNNLWNFTTTTTTRSYYFNAKNLYNVLLKYKEMFEMVQLIVNPMEMGCQVYAKNGDIDGISYIPLYKNPNHIPILPSSPTSSSSELSLQHYTFSITNILNIFHLISTQANICWLETVNNICEIKWRLSDTSCEFIIMNTLPAAAATSN